ncbi:MAG TPA: hypothetical protein VKV32_00040, partial [Stellaceae bacterium]|nr:hypothetical protein [Stellaceae bacterium]
YMLWRGGTLLVESRCNGSTPRPTQPAAALDARAQEIALDFEHRLLQSHWSVARSTRLLEAMRELENNVKPARSEGN